MSPALRRVLLIAAVLSAAPRVRAESDPAVARGVQFLRGKAVSGKLGETALVALALLKSDVPAADPAVAACVNRIRKRFVSGVYEPEERGGHDVYEAAVVALALSNLEVEARRAELAVIAAYLVGLQKANGSWDYTTRDRGDTSISQYAVLGLWEAENGGASVPPEVWDRAAQWFMSSQSPAGSWNYHRDEPDTPETLSMTAAGVGSLLICQRQLARYRRGGDTGSALLTPLSAEGPRARYDVTTANARIEQAVKRGMAWLGSHFSTGNNAVVGQTSYYALYGIERIGALADKETLGRVNWFEQGRQFIHSTQRADGAWDAMHGDIPNTSWAILFITKSTAKTIRRIEVKSLGAGTLLGGRGLPSDLSNLTVAGGRVVSRPMNGAVEGMLAVLEDPRAQNADSALGGLVGRYRAEGPAVLRPHKDRFRKILGDRDPGLRRVAAWSLARTADLDVAPALIDALTDPDESVVTVAREGLQLLSRKIGGLGPPSPSTPAQRLEAARRWRAWYASIRPLDLEGQDAAPGRSLARRRGGPMSAAAAPTTATRGPGPGFDPKVFGESPYDRVTSMLMAVVTGAAIVVGWLYVIYKTNQAYASRVTSPLQIVDVFGGGGGSPDGTPGSTEKVDVSGADAASQASNNEETAADFTPPAVEQTSAAMLDAAADAGQSLAEVDLGAVMPNGGPVAGGRRTSKLGTGGPGLGLGPGDGGVPADQRWSIVYNTGQSPEEYARQLDALGVELAVVSGSDRLTYVSRFSDPVPTTRFGTGRGDDRLYFLWQGRGRKGSDVALLKKAGIDIGEGVVMQFYPKAVEQQLLQLETRYRGRSPAEIRFTRFSVVPKGGGYGFAVLAQEPLR